MMINLYFSYFIYMFLACTFLILLGNFKNLNVLIYFSLFDKKSSLMFFDLLMSLNWLKVLFLSVLLLISGSVGIFSMKYMSGDPNEVRFFYILNLFMFSMIILMILPHYMFFLLGWDGLGFTSFLLMKYYKSKISWFSSFKTFLINRLGDGMLLGSMGVYLFQGHFWFFFESFSKFLIFYCVLGLLTKSAHFPFSSWLPAAMAAPTPVSALVHSSTLVTAGLYILIRFSFFFSVFTLVFISVLGMMTILLGGMSALISFDSKKVVAYSTLSNLGFLGVSLGLGCIGVAMFHLFTHGISKALLFISVGKMMEANSHSQDLRKFSNLKNQNLVSMVCIIWSVLSLCGLFFLSCFYSKDYLFEVQQASEGLNCVILFLLYLSIFITYSYSLRLIFFFTKKNKKMLKSFFPLKLKIFEFFSKIFLFLGVLFFGLFFQFYFLFDFSSTYIFKMIFYLIFLLIFIFKMKKISFMSVFHFFNGGFWYMFVFLGDYFFNLFDLGLFSNLKSSFKNFMNKVSQKMNLIGFSNYQVLLMQFSYFFFMIWYLLF